MKKLHFENTHEFEKIFKKKDQQITDAIVEGISKAVESQKKSANLFLITFENADLSYEISLPSSQWNTALKTCLQHYTELSESNKAIDTYLLQKLINKDE